MCGDGLWPTIRESFTTVTYYKFIVWIVRLAPSLGQVNFLLLATTHIYKYGDYDEARCPFHGAQLYEYRQLPLEFIA